MKTGSATSLTKYGRNLSDFWLLKNPTLPDNKGGGGIMYYPYQQDERIWVQGEEAAKAYLVTANGFVRLWDSTQPIFYEKRADQTGRSYMEAYKYERIVRSAPESEGFTQKQGNYITEQIQALQGRIEALERKQHDKKSHANDTAV